MRLYQHIDVLTPHEREALKLLAQGLTNIEIARRLGIVERTARDRVSVILRKLGVSNRVQAALYAWRHGYVDMDEAWKAVKEREWGVTA
jgi:DNA-binding NarL/FixJ family response regulator